MTIIWNNIRTVHQRILARYLRRRGWVVFYLEPTIRRCDPKYAAAGCWLALYEEGESGGDTK